jgi:alpha-beta hydrolase superfamily lysophospholipase
VDGIGKPCLAGLLLFSVTPLTGARSSRDRGTTPGQAPATSASTPATPTTTAAIARPCLREINSARAFWFRTSAGAVLVGVVLGRGRTGLVLAHGRGGDLCEWLPQGQAFARQGYRVLAFNFEGYGDSQPGSGPDARIDTDVVAAAEQLRRRGAPSIVLIGSSMGATAVLSAATRIRPPVAGVVSLSGPGAFGPVDAWTAMARLRVPVLFVAAADDHPFVGAARAMYRRARMADKRLLVVRRGHGRTLLTFSDDGPKVRAAVRMFIADHTRP